MRHPNTVEARAVVGDRRHERRQVTAQGGRAARIYALMAYVVMACIVMAYMVMAYIVMASI